MNLDVSDITRGEAITTGAAHPARELALVECDPRLLRSLRKLLVELVLELLNPTLIAL